MRAMAAVLVIGTALAAQTTTTTTTTKKSTPSTTAHKSTATHRLKPRSPMMPVPADPKATEGLAALGTMPAVTGVPAQLFALRFVDLKIGNGEEAKMSMPPNNVVFYTVHYTGWTTDGAKFDSSVDRGEPIVFPVGLKRVIAGWDAGFQGMRVGGKRRLILPWQLAYGAAGHPPAIPEKADLIFDVELVGQGNTPNPVTGTHFDPPPTPPAAVSAAPAKPAERSEEHPE